LADLPLGTMADDLERLVVRDRRPHHRLDVSGVTYLQDIHLDPRLLGKLSAMRPHRRPPETLLAAQAPETRARLVEGGDKRDHSPPPFDYGRTVQDIDTSIAGESRAAQLRYKVASIAIETSRWRQACSVR